ncbi:hypothetical protein HAX54_009707 [Datura stramonium]|uniref:Uncharacterized protein n=1 Tax=Datura stramonium TaxID=4076 RepID=A0ABS8TF76_DATST|nr:hypothetical protein [Datura stramonium]
MELVAENQQNQESLSAKLEDTLKLVDAESVKPMFIKGMNTICKVDIVKISQCSSKYMRNRLELFEKQVEITQSIAGTPSNDRLLILVAECISLPWTMPLKVLHSCDIDENGIRYMVLCRHFGQ